MLLLEHQGKALLARFGIAIPGSMLVRDVADLQAAMADGHPKVFKAQVAAGGRGKAGGIVAVDRLDAAIAAYRRLQELTIGGHRVEAILVESRVTFAAERYVAIQVDSGRLQLMLAARGGVDIEAITEHDPSNIRTIEVDVVAGPNAATLTAAFEDLGFPTHLWPDYERIARQLYRLARACDAATVEINPLVETPEGRVLALDARVFIDETALARQPALAALRPRSPDAGAPTAPKPSFRTNPAGGSIGLIGFGSGLNITFMDWIATLGGRVGVLVDIDAMVTGGQARAGFAAAFEHMDRDPAVRSILLCIISCGNRMDEVVEAMIAALGERPAAAKPLILHLRGNRMRFAEPLLAAAGLTNSASLAAAVTNVVAAATERRS
jgi:succinyl-CoA synthetase beta subunit